MKGCVIFIAIVICSLNLKAQVKTRKLSNDTTVYTAVEVEPMPQGGMDKFFTVLMNKMVVSKDCFNAGYIGGRLVIALIVEKNGTLSNVHVINQVPECIKDEVKRIMKLTPAWVPGMQNGKPVRVSYTIPIACIMLGDQ